MGIERSAIGFNDATQSILNNWAKYAQTNGIRNANSNPLVSPAYAKGSSSYANGNISSIGQQIADSLEISTRSNTPTMPENTVNTTNTNPLSDLINRPQSNYSDSNPSIMAGREKASFDGANDGKISFKEKAVNFGKGLISPITTMLKSPKAAMAGILSVAAGSILIAATGGAAAPIMVAAGVITGGTKIVVNAIKASKADTDEKARKAWQGMGTGTAITATSVLASKSAVKCNGGESTGFIQSTLQCFKNLPSAFSKSANQFSSGAYIGNIRNYFSGTAPSKKPDEGEVEVIQSEFAGYDDSPVPPEEIIDVEFTEV